MRQTYFEIIFFVLFSVFLVSRPAFAKNLEKATHCVAVFRQMNHEMISRHILPETQKRIAEYFLDETLSPQERAKKAFEAVVSDRIRLLPKKDAEKVRKFLDQAVVRNYQKLGSQTSGTFSAPFPFFKKSISIDIPERFSESIIEYAILTHELEHYIQDLRISSEFGGDFKLFIDHIKNFVDHGYEREMGAMVAEFNFMKTIPLEIRKDVKKEVMLYRFNLSRPSLNFIFSILDIDSFDVSEYLQRQHRLGRYNRGYFLKEHEQIQAGYKKFKTQILVLMSAYGVIPGIVGISNGLNEIKLSCKSLLSQKKSPSGERGALFEFCDRIKLMEWTRPVF